MIAGLAIAAIAIAVTAALLISRDGSTDQVATDGDRTTDVERDDPDTSNEDVGADSGSATETGSEGVPAPPDTRAPSPPPQGEWAAVFVSDPARSVADGVRARLAGQVARPVDVFHTREYRSLRPGYWVAGVRGFATAREAIDLCFRLGRGDRNLCYARRLLNGPGVSWDAPAGSGQTNPDYVVYPD